MLGSVTRPDGTKVQFNYGDWGIVTDIQEFSDNGTLRYEASYNFPPASAGQLTGPPVYTQRTDTTFDANGNQKQGIWSYQQAVASPTPGSNIVSCFAVTDPAGTIHMTTFSAGGNGFDGLPVQSIIATGSNAPCSGSPSTILHTTNMQWTSDQDSWGNFTGINARRQSVTDILEDGRTQSQVQFAGYDAHGDATDIKTFDFGLGNPGPLLREIVVSYATNVGNIFGLPTDMQLKDGGGNVLSHQTFTYDNYGNTPVQGYSSLPPGFDSGNPAFASNSTTPRGNLTGATVYANAAAGTGAITSTFAYDMFGNLLSSQSGCCSFSSSSYSATTEYAYPDSVSVGPPTNRLTTTFTYTMSNGRVATSTDPNGQKTQFNYDIDSRIANTTTPDGITATYSYDDAAENPAVAVSSTANSLVSRAASDFLGRPLTREILNGGSVASTTSYINDLLGRPTQASNPFGPSDTPQYTTYVYDSLGRQTSLTPPALAGTNQNPYQTQYSPAIYTDAAGKSHAGVAIQTTDPANKQRKLYKDALGRLVRVDEPGGGPAATTASGSFTINGTLQSWAATQTATSGHIELTFSGTLQSKTSCSPSGQPCSDSGSITITVNTPSGAFTKSAAYSSATGSDSSQTVRALANAFHSDSTSPVDAIYYGADEFGNIVMDLIARATGSVTNYPLVTSIASSDPTDFPSPSFQVSAGPSLIGGKDASTAPTSGHAYLSFSGSLQSKASCSATSGQPCTDSGSISTTVTTSAGAFTKSAAYSSATGSDSGQAVQALANAFHSDTTSPVDAFFTTDESGNYVMYLTARTTGSGTNYPLSTSIVSNDPTDFPSPSFQVSEGSSLVGGQSGTAGSTVYDSGVVYVSVGPFIASAPYSQSGNNTAAMVASALVSGSTGLNRTSFPVRATVSGSTITLAYKVAGSAGNLPVNISSSSANPDNPSFSSPGTTLSGGADAQPSLTSPNSTFYSYDALGHLLQVVQGQQTRTYAYDSLGRITSSCIPETANKCATLTYTDFSAVQTRTDPRNIMTSYGFDPLNRVNDIKYSDGTTPEVKFTYGAAGASNNGAGRLVSSAVLSNANGSSKTYQYDAMGRTTQVTETLGGNSYTTKYSYANGQLSGITYPSGSAGSGTQVNYNYDPIGRLATVVVGGTTVYAVNSYNAAGAPLTNSFGNGMAGSYSFNNQLQLSSIIYGSATMPLVNLTYDYGSALDNGQIQGITDNLVPSRSTSYVYDALGRLQQAQTVDETSPASWNLQFCYDRYGNRLSETPVGGSAAMPNSQLIIDPTTNHVATSGFSYDAAGNMTSDSFNNYGFDAANRIVSVSQLGVSTPTATYAYDDAGLRVNKNGNLYIYSGGHVIAEYANGVGAASPNAEYVYAGGQRVATLSNGVLAYHYWDHLSVRSSADGSGNVMRTYGSFPFGEKWYETGTANKWKFTTYENDSESGLNYATARFHAPRLGQFISLDPLSGSLRTPQSLNRYAYVGNDPTNRVDPSGALWLYYNPSPPDLRFFEFDLLQIQFNQINAQFGGSNSSGISGSSVNPTVSVQGGQERGCTSNEAGSSDVCVHADPVTLYIDTGSDSWLGTFPCTTALTGATANCSSPVVTGGAVFTHIILNRMSKSELLNLLGNGCVIREMTTPRALRNLTFGGAISAFIELLFHGAEELGPAGAAGIGLEGLHELGEAGVECAQKGEYAPLGTFQF